MSSPGIQRPVISNRAEQTSGSDLAGLKADSLIDLALHGLLPMFDPSSQLFCCRLKLERSGLVREGLSRRYTIISLLGLHRAEANGSHSPVDAKAVLSGLLHKTTWISNLGDLGLLLWLCALARPESLEEVCSRLDVQNALAQFREAREGRTMELAWFLSGLAHTVLALPANRLKLTDLATRAYELLAENQGDQGIFGHLAPKKTVAGVFRGRIGTFADQVYPIYALTRFAQAYQVHSALQMAQRCAEAICKVQGPLGQWWWHYDASTGQVLRKYPVYAVHQDGMAPMALFALGEATRSDYREPILKGLAWINGNNELGRDVRDASAGVIWRSIYRPASWKKYRDEVCELLRLDQPAVLVGDLMTLCECRPYHLGWILYAFAGHNCE